MKPTPTRDHIARARRLHDRAIVIDTHCDTTLRLADPTWDIATRHDDGHLDIPRMRDAGISAVCFAVWAPKPARPGDGVHAARQQLDRIDAMIARYGHDLAGARTAADIRAAAHAGRIAVLIAIEGGYLIEDSLDILREYRERGAVYLTLTHGFHTSWADSSGVHESLAPRHGGLAPFGRDVVRELNRLGMMVDVSHVSDATFSDVIEASAAPVIASHSSCRAVSPHRRNLTDDMIRAIAATGGVVQINFAAAFIDPDHPPLQPDASAVPPAADPTGGPADKRIPTPRPTHVTPLSRLIDHFDHALALVGPQHVGIGSDFDGVPALPNGMEHCGRLTNLTAALLARGHTEDDLAPVLGANVLRVMERCAAIAARMD